MKDERRPSTIIRDNRVHEIHQEIMASLGNLKNIVSKSYIYIRYTRERDYALRLSHTLSIIPATKKINTKLILYNAKHLLF